MQLTTPWRQYLFLFLLYGCISASLLFALASNTSIPNEMDIVNHLVGIILAKLALIQGQFPLRVAPLLNNGWQYPLYQFYSTTSYLITGLIYTWLTPANPLIAYKIALWCALITGGIYMYRLAFWFVQSTPAAILAGIVYLTSPYLIITTNFIGAFNETLALGIVPAVMYYTLRAYEYPAGFKFILQSSLVWYVLATIHLLTFLCTTLFAGMLLLFITINHSRQWKNLVAAGSAYIFGCILAIWYLAPIVLLGKYFEINRTFDYLHFAARTPLLANLLSPFISVANKPSTNIIDLIQPNIGMPVLLAAVICGYAYLKKSTSVSKHADFLLGSLLAMFFIAFLLVWSPINFWQWLPQSLLATQYSWRFLGQTAWIGALLSAWAACWVFRSNFDARHMVFGTLILITIAVASIPLIKFDHLELNDELQNPVLPVNPDSYLLDARKHNQLANIYDNVMIDPLMIINGSAYSLLVNTSAVIPPPMLQAAKEPVIILNGDIPESISTQNLQLTAILNGNSYASRALSYGRFNWTIPVKSFRDNNIPLTLQFAVANTIDRKEQNSVLALPLSVALGGFLKPDKVMSVQQTQSHCHQSNENTICVINVPPTIALVELPIFYYPDMLDIRLNGRSVNYYSVAYNSHLIAGIKPEPGKTNLIKFRFRGLMWANYTSFAAWLLWLIIFLYGRLPSR